MCIMNINEMTAEKTSGTLDIGNSLEDRVTRIKAIEIAKIMYGFTPEEERKHCNCYTCKKV